MCYYKIFPQHYWVDTTKIVSYNDFNLNIKIFKNICQVEKRLEPNVSNSFRVNCNEIAFIALMQTKYIHTSFIVFQCWKCSDEHIFNSIKLRMSKF